MKKYKFKNLDKKDNTTKRVFREVFMGKYYRKHK